MAKSGRAVHVVEIKRRYKDKTYVTYLLRHTYREDGKVKQQTLANLSALPLEAIHLIRGVLRGVRYVPDGEAFEKLRTWLHGHVAAVEAMARRLGVDRLLAPRAGPERDLIVAMIVARVVEPHTKLATTRWWQNTTLALDPAIRAATEDDLYKAMDWLLQRQSAVQRVLARRHLTEGGIVLYDLSSSYVEGTQCPLAARGHNRDGKQGKRQINYGLMLDPVGRPVAIQVDPGNTADPKTVADQLDKIKLQYHLEHVVLVGDRGMLTSARIRDLQAIGGIDWISALRSTDIRKLAESGAIAQSMFDRRDLVEISAPDFPGERLVVCYNPLLAAERDRKRQALLQATEDLLTQLARRVASGRLKDPAKIGKALGRVLGKYKVEKHFQCDLGDGRLTFQRRADTIRREEALDGIYVVRTNVSSATMPSADLVRGYKSLARAEQAFRILKSVDLRIRPIHHWTERRVRAHIFLCMLAYYVEWHLRQVWAPYLFEDAHPGLHPHDSPVRPALRSRSALQKARTKRTVDGEPVHSFATLLAHLSTVTRDEVRVPAHPEVPPFYLTTTPSPLQQELFRCVGLEPGPSSRQNESG